jgi:antitoxin component YwqK of YwqJK toxin-antitoxin module
MPNGRKEQQYYKNGIREGIWKMWNKDGEVINQCEYRNGDPWDGICYLRDMKAWLCEYKKGKPWNGYLPRLGKHEYPEDWGYFIDGKEVSYEEYCAHHGKEGSKHSFYGLHYLGGGESESITNCSTISTGALR